MQELTPFGNNIWITDGPNVRDAGLLFTTRMTVVRLHDGSVWVESPVNLLPRRKSGNSAGMEPTWLLRVVMKTYYNRLSRFAIVRSRFHNGQEVTCPI